MSHIKFFAIAALFITSFAQAQLPEGRYSGFVSNNPFNEWCRLNQAVMDFGSPDSDGSVTVRWEESGFASGGAGFCDNQFDATFTPNGSNSWTVNFLWNFDLVFGRATLNNGVLTIDATYSGMNTGFQRFHARLGIREESISYDRRIERFGPSLFANGTLYK